MLKKKKYVGHIRSVDADSMVHDEDEDEEEVFACSHLNLLDC